ncbi:MAG: hypothetical protein ABEJ59_01945 [Halanaeroarchaeum sp.]
MSARTDRSAMAPLRRHPVLAAAAVLGALALVAGFVLGGTDPVNGLRLAVVGAVGLAFGLAGLVALEVQRAIDATGR